MNRFGESFFDHRVEHHDRLMLIQQDELRVDVCLNWKLMQQTRTETMDRGDDGAFKRPLVTHPRLPFFL